MKKIQLVDDGPILRKHIQRVLSKQNYEVEVNSSSKEFLKRFAEFKPDLCLIDINIDEVGDGLLLIKAIRNKIGHQIPIIVISSHEEQKDITNALNIGANDYICKPIEPTILKSKVACYLNPDSVDDLPVFSLPSNINPFIKLKRSLKLYRISEYGIEFTTKDFYYQESYLELQGGLLDLLELDRTSIRLKVISTEIDKENDINKVYAQFEEDDEELLSKVRDFMAK